MCKQQPAGTACRRDVHPDNGRQQWGTAAHGVVVPCRDHCVSVKEENQLPRGLCEPGIQRRPAEVFRRGTIPQPHNHNHHNHNHHNQHSKHSQPAQPASTVWCQVSMATQFVPRSAHQSDTPEPMVTRRAFFSSFFPSFFGSWAATTRWKKSQDHPPAAAVPRRWYHDDLERHRRQQRNARLGKLSDHALPTKKTKHQKNTKLSGAAWR